MSTKLAIFSLICLIAACSSPAKQTYLSNPEDLNGHWNLVSAFPDTTDVRKAAIDQSPSLTINSAKKTIGGYSGCNGFGGEFILEKDKIEIGNLMATQRACLGSIEPILFKHLKNINRYEVSKDSLKLYAQDTLLLAFAR